MVFIGIDVGGTAVKIGLVDEEGRILAWEEIPTLVGRPYEEMIRDMGVCALRVLEKAGFPMAEVAAVGVGIPGIADHQKGEVIFCTNMGWTDVPLRRELQKYIDKPVFIDNDATVGALAESVCGVSAGCHSSVFLPLGTGVGSGVILEGKPWSGFHGVGSEIGHAPMDIDGELCSCGNRGCMERYCSATAVTRMGREALNKHPDSHMAELCGGDGEQLTAKMVFDAAKAGDEAALTVFHRYVDYLCRGIYMVMAMLDPEMIVIGGGISKAGDFLMNAVRERIPDFRLYKTLPYSRIEIAKLGADAGVIGAAMLGKYSIQEAKAG